MNRSIYVACLASYNAGRLHGRWIDATQGIDGVREEIAEMLRESPHPNVEVDCPTCEGSGRLGGADVLYEASRLCGGIAEAPPSRECFHCQGTGKVPSAEEWAVHDYDGIPSSFGEYPSLERVVEFAEALEELDENGLGDAFEEFWDLGTLADDEPVRNAVDRFNDCYRGHFPSFRDYAEEFVDSIGLLSEMSEHLRYYFDLDAYARDLKNDYTVVDAGRGVYVFSDN